jgi:hypothetical protein
MLIISPDIAHRFAHPLFLLTAQVASALLNARKLLTSMVGMEFAISHVPSKILYSSLRISPARVRLYVLPVALPTIFQGDVSLIVLKLNMVGLMGSLQLV